MSGGSTSFSVWNTMSNQITPTLDYPWIWWIQSTGWRVSKPTIHIWKMGPDSRWWYEEPYCELLNNAQLPNTQQKILSLVKTHSIQSQRTTKWPDILSSQSSFPALTTGTLRSCILICQIVTGLVSIRTTHSILIPIVLPATYVVTCENVMSLLSSNTLAHSTLLSHLAQTWTHPLIISLSSPRQNTWRPVIQLSCCSMLPNCA